MKTIAIVFCFNRVETLKRSAQSLFEASNFIPDEVVFIDDGSSEPVALELLSIAQQYRDKAKITLWIKAKNEGFSDSAIRALAYIRQAAPDFAFFIESDYVFNKHGLDAVMEVFNYTSEGQLALGIVGADHPDFYLKHITEVHYSDLMIKQLGEDNINRKILYQPRPINTRQFRVNLELVSNTCWTCYLNWRLLEKVLIDQPELNDLLDQACEPRINPSYPMSGIFKMKRVVDDGMLSHAISLCWNRWAIKNRVDRDRFAAWLNIKPSVATHVSEGGMHHVPR